MDFHPQVKKMHERCGTSVPLSRFVKVIDPKGMGFSSHEELYKPVRFNVKLAGDETHGTVQLEVPVHANEDGWIQDMQTRIEKMMGLQGKGVEFRTMTGQPLDQVPLRRLHKVGDLNVVLPSTSSSSSSSSTTKDKESRIVRTSTVAPAVPIEYSATKAQKLKEWFAANVARGLPEKIGALLDKCNNHVEVDEAIRGHGPVQRTIEEHILQSVKPDWPEFVRAHHVKTAESADAASADLLLSQISTRMLSNVRSMVSAYKTDVARHLSNKMASSIAEMGGNTSHFKPVMSAMFAPQTSASKQQDNGYKMFCRIASDALNNPILETSVIRALNLESPALRQQKLQKSRRVEQSLSASHHPWFSHIHQVTMPLTGQFPSDYIARHTSKDMSAKARFLGDAAQTYQAYQLFSGQHVAPPSLTLKAGRPIEAPVYETIEARRGSKSSKGSKSSRSSKNSRGKEGRRNKMTVYMGNSLPELVPIEGHCSKAAASTCSKCKSKGKTCSRCARARADMRAALEPIDEHMDLAAQRGYNDERPPSNGWSGKGGNFALSETEKKNRVVRDYRPSPNPLRPVSSTKGSGKSRVANNKLGTYKQSLQGSGPTGTAKKQTGKKKKKTTSKAKTNQPVVGKYSDEQKNLGAKMVDNAKKLYADINAVSQKVTKQLEKIFNYETEINDVYSNLKNTTNTDVAQIFENVNTIAGNAQKILDAAKEKYDDAEEKYNDKNSQYQDEVKKNDIPETDIDEAGETYQDTENILRAFKETYEKYKLETRKIVSIAEAITTNFKENDVSSIDNVEKTATSDEIKIIIENIKTLKENIQTEYDEASTEYNTFDEYLNKLPSDLSEINKEYNLRLGLIQTNTENAKQDLENIDSNIQELEKLKKDYEKKYNQTGWTSMFRAVLNTAKYAFFKEDYEKNKKDAADVYYNIQQVMVNTEKTYRNYVNETTTQQSKPTKQGNASENQSSTDSDDDGNDGNDGNDDDDDNDDQGSPNPAQNPPRGKTRGKPKPAPKQKFVYEDVLIDPRILEDLSEKEAKGTLTRKEVENVRDNFNEKSPDKRLNLPNDKNAKNLIDEYAKLLGFPSLLEGNERRNPSAKVLLPRLKKRYQEKNNKPYEDSFQERSENDPDSLVLFAESIYAKSQSRISSYYSSSSIPPLIPISSLFSSDFDAFHSDDDNEDEDYFMGSGMPSLIPISSLADYPSEGNPTTAKKMPPLIPISTEYPLDGEYPSEKKPTDAKARMASLLVPISQEEELPSVVSMADIFN